MSQMEIDQQKRRALKAQKARQTAIESLRLKREQRKQEVKRIAEQEIVSVLQLRMSSVWTKLHRCVLPSCTCNTSIRTSVRTHYKNLSIKDNFVVSELQ